MALGGGRLKYPSINYSELGIQKNFNFFSAKIKWCKKVGIPTISSKQSLHQILHSKFAVTPDGLGELLVSELVKTAEFRDTNNSIK